MYSVGIRSVIVAPEKETNKIIITIIIRYVYMYICIYVCVFGSLVGSRPPTHPHPSVVPLPPHARLTHYASAGQA